MPTKHVSYNNNNNNINSWYGFFLHNNISICKNVTIKRGVTANNLAADAHNRFMKQEVRASLLLSSKCFIYEKGFPSPVCGHLLFFITDINKCIYTNIQQIALYRHTSVPDAHAAKSFVALCPEAPSPLPQSPLTLRFWNKRRSLYQMFAWRRGRYGLGAVGFIDLKTEA